MEKKTNQEGSALDVIGADLEQILPDAASHDTKAQSEADAFANDELDKVSKQSQHTRDESLKNTIHRIFIWGIWLAGLGLIIIFIARIAHFILPSYLSWLDASRLQEIDRLLFSGAIGGLLTKYLEPVLNNGKK